MNEEQKLKVFEAAADYIAGSCMLSESHALKTVIEFDGIQEEVTDELEAEFLVYLEKIELMRCEECGWYGHPGEFCECRDEDTCGLCGNYISNGDCTCEDE